MCFGKKIGQIGLILMLPKESSSFFQYGQSEISSKLYILI
jgi:hypothetical protein